MDGGRVKLMDLPLRSFKHLRNKDTTCEAKLSQQIIKVLHRAKQTRITNPTHNPI